MGLGRDFLKYLFEIILPLLSVILIFRFQVMVLVTEFSAFIFEQLKRLGDLGPSFGDGHDCPVEGNDTDIVLFRRNLEEESVGRTNNLAHRDLEGPCGHLVHLAKHPPLQELQLADRSPFPPTQPRN